MTIQTCDSLNQNFCAEIGNFFEENPDSRLDSVEIMMLLFPSIAQKVGEITDNEIPDAACSGTAKVFHYLEDKYYICVETQDESVIFSCLEFDEALKIATDELYNRVVFVD